MIKKQLQKNSHFPVLKNRTSALTKFSAKRAQKIPANLLMVVVVLVCMLLLAACSKKQESETTTVSSRPTQATAAKPRPIQKPASSAMRLPAPAVNQFDFSNKKDPFKPFLVLKVEPKNTPDNFKKAQLSSLPIHSFDVSQFKLIGIITGGRGSQAMVTDPGGKGYVLKVGMTIGKNDGKVISITASGVDILEQFKDDSGRVRKEKIKLTLPRKQ